MLPIDVSIMCRPVGLLDPKEFSLIPHSNMLIMNVPMEIIPETRRAE
jgi:hypothetical protein